MSHLVRQKGEAGSAAGQKQRRMLCGSMLCHAVRGPSPAVGTCRPGQSDICDQRSMFAWLPSAGGGVPERAVVSIQHFCILPSHILGY